MELSVTVFAKDAKAEERISTELKQAAGELAELSVLRAPELGQILFVDEDYPGLQGFLEELNRSGDRRGRAVFLVVAEGAGVPEELISGHVDDVIVRPFRSLEILSRIRQAQQVLMWDEVHEINASFSGMIEQLRGDLRLAERLQKTKLAARFPELRGFKVAHRYLAGMKAGGDHFDIVESKDAQQISLVLSDSSSYGLSSAVLSALVRVMMRLSSEESRSCSETIRRVQEELKATLAERDQLSLFYGVISRKDYRLRFLNLGSSRAFYASSGRAFSELPVQAAAIRAGSGSIDARDGDLVLEPNGRLALISDGFIEAAGGVYELGRILNDHRERESPDLVNELVFKVKKSLVEEDDLPSQDCTAAVFDVDARMIRLAN